MPTLRTLLPLSLLFCGLATATHAQTPAPSAPPTMGGAPCLDVINDAPYVVFGNVFGADRRQANFRLETGAGVRFCFNGPLYPGDRVELTTKTLIPTFACRTKVNQRIIIHGRRLPEGGTKTWADCT
jgi:hypothetical protein